jgi:hypothetical protein
MLNLPENSGRLQIKVALCKKRGADYIVKIRCLPPWRPRPSSSSGAPMESHRSLFHGDSLESYYHTTGGDFHRPEIILPLSLTLTLTDIVQFRAKTDKIEERRNYRWTPSSVSTKACYVQHSSAPHLANKQGPR